MNTEDGALLLTQWLSPSFPIGAFAYSHGFEQAIETGLISSSTHLAEWLKDCLQSGGGFCDAVLLVAAYDADTSQVTYVDSVAKAFASSSERLTETEDQGAAFSRTVDAVWRTEIGSLCYPVAMGRAAQAKNLPLDLTLRHYVHAFAANLISAAVRLIPLGQTEGQTVLAGLSPIISSVAKKARLATLDDLTSTCFALDIAAMHHETQYSKVFRT